MKKLFILTLFLFSHLFASPAIKFAENRKPSSVDSIKISFIGDILIHDALYEKVVKSKSQDFNQLWPDIIPLFQVADFSYGNLEGPVAMGIDNKLKDNGDVGFIYDKIIYSGTNFSFNYHPKLIDSLLTAGIDIVSTANNHSYDRGSVGINKTIDILNQKNMSFIGTRKANSKDDFFKIIKIKNFNVAWVSCTEMLNGYKDKFSQLLLCFDQSTEIKKIISDLKKRPDVDAVIVTPHWGTEYKQEPNNLQKKYARDFLEAGAIAIIGSHPHVLQPVEKYITTDGRETFIAYSLGNFAAYQKDIERKASAVVYLDFSKDENGKVWISNYSYEPTMREVTLIYPARKNRAAVKHIEKFLGPLGPSEVIK